MNGLIEKLEWLMNKNNINQQELANALNVSKQSINHLCNGRIKRSKFLPELANYFQVDYSWLISDGTDASLPIEDQNRFLKIPVFSSTNLSKDTIVDNKLDIKNIETKEYELTDDPEHKHLFVMKSSNNAIKFRFGSKSTLIFHNELRPSDNDFVIAYLPDKDIFVYRDLKILKNGKKHLIPLDDDIYKQLILRDMDIIVATLYEKRIKRTINL